MTRPMKKRVLVCCATIALALAAAIVLRGSLGAAGVFRRYVCNPIPPSVKYSKMDRVWELSGHTYVMHFKISRDDLSRIFGSRRFKEVSQVRYRHGDLYWDLDPSHGEALSLYPHGMSGPEWFRPNDWKNSTAYRYKERLTDYRGHWQVLLYNEDLSEAYFIEYQEGHW